MVPSEKMKDSSGTNVSNMLSYKLGSIASSVIKKLTGLETAERRAKGIFTVVMIFILLVINERNLFWLEWRSDQMPMIEGNAPKEPAISL